MDLLLVFIVGIFSAILSYVATFFLRPKLIANGMFGNDINKPDKPQVAEMGGLGILTGFTFGVLVAIFISTFYAHNLNLVFVLASLLTIILVGLIGMVDDLIDMPQIIKALLPLFAAIPLVVVNAAGDTSIVLPFIGLIDFGSLYIFLLIPLAVAVCSNLTNMLAGFNGMEAGMGFVMFAFLSFFAIVNSKFDMLAISLPMMGSLLGFLILNRYPSKIFPGDVGTLSIGAALACAVIIGNFEALGFVLIFPYILDFAIKLLNRFPSKGWAGIFKDGKLTSPEKPISLAQYVMKFSGGIIEPNLVSFFVFLEFFFGLIALFIFYLR